MAESSKAGGETFARDLGYLDAFFDKLEAHAASLQPAAGARLRALIGEERTRWGEIRALVAGKAPAADARPAAAPTAAPQRAPAPTSAHAFTVGSLAKR